MPTHPQYIILRLLFGTAVLMGAVQSLTLWPFQAPDEAMHWRASVSRTNSLIPGQSSSCDPLLGLPALFEYEMIRFNSEQSGSRGLYRKSFAPPQDCEAHGLNYGFVLSYPGAFAAVTVAKLLPLSPIGTFYLARLLQGLL